MNLTISRAVWRYVAFALLAIHFGVILAIWSVTSLPVVKLGGPSTLLALGQLFGLLAAGCALLQFMLMGRAPWLEHAFGLERLAKLHRLNGYATITLIVIHPMLLTLGYAGLAHIGLITQYVNFLTKFQDVWKAFIAELLFLGVVGTSIYIVRKHLAYERWYWVHLMVYAAILLAFSHQVHIGGSFIGSPGFKLYWYSLYAFVGLNVFFGRFFGPAYNYWRYRFVIDEVVTETPDTRSFYIAGRGLERFKVLPGQFIVLWVPNAQFWGEEHPFSVSAVPADGRIRITVKAVGDYSKAIHSLKPGTKVVLSGPYGSFTVQPSRHTRRLYIAGGVGITPIRTMIESQEKGLDSVLIYGNKTQADTVFAAELAAHAKAGLTVHHVYSRQPGYAGETGRVDAALVARLAPDFRDRQVYLCGPSPMMEALITGLTAAGLPRDQLHFERFALHPVS